MPDIVSREEWLNQRRILLAQEKEFSKQRDALSAKRREMPWVAVDTPYRFAGAKGEIPFADLFDGHSQLIVYHFMYGADWDAGCTSCSFWADNFNTLGPHLGARDAGFVAVSSAPYDMLAAYQKRMGWGFNWVSAQHNSFNADFNVGFTQAEIDDGSAVYNYEKSRFPGLEAPGVSVFTRQQNGKIFHSYSTYARGIDMLNGAYHYLDLLPKGRDEQDLPWPMAWLKRRDEY